jgi:hypothetical protein
MKTTLRRFLTLVALVAALATLPSVAVGAPGGGGGGSGGGPHRSPKPTATVKPSATPVPTPTPTPTPNPTPTPTPTPTPSAGNCALFPSTNVWNEDISSLPVESDSATLLGTMGLSTGLHPDFSATGYGIPYNVVDNATPLLSVSFYYASESDAGPYPIPSNPLIEGDTDRHLLMWNRAGCKLFELYDAVKASNGTWTAGSGAIWDLTSNALRPDGWTSADAAGLPILPGLVRYDEVAAGLIGHALRFTVPQTRAAHIYPARHDASSLTSASYPPMGLRVRLKASVNISGFSAANQVILMALKRYGMMLADNGSAWYITGAPDSRWNDSDLHLINQINGSNFEVVDTSGLVNG